MACNDKPIGLCEVHSTGRTMTKKELSNYSDL